MNKTIQKVLDIVVVLIGVGMIIAFLGKASAPVASGVAFVLIGMRHLIK